MASEPAATLLPRDLVALEIDVDRMTHGPEVLERMKGTNQGLPWMVVLGAEGRILATSADAAGDNIGCPYRDEEIAHFVAMLKAGRRALTDADLEALRASLVAVRTADEARKAAGAR